MVGSPLSVTGIVGSPQNACINAKNLPLYVNNTSGIMGVSFHRRQRKWNARIMVDKKPIHLGSLTTMEKAIEARKEAEIKYGFHYNHGK